MAVLNKYNQFKEALAEDINCATDTFRCILSNTAPSATHTNRAAANELATGGGYTADGNVCAVVTSEQVNGVYKLQLATPAQWVSTGAGFTYRYAIIWNQTNDELVGWYDNGASVLIDGTKSDTLDVSLSQANGLFDLS